MFLLGSGQDRAEAQSLLHRFEHAARRFHSAMQQTREVWTDVTETVQVKTHEPGRWDVLVNHCCSISRSLSCRVWGGPPSTSRVGRTAFRDQLQDVMAAVYSRPGVEGWEQILRAAARQFVEGDVQHWWHPPGGGDADAVLRRPAVATARRRALRRRHGRPDGSGRDRFVHPFAAPPAGRGA